MSVKMGTKRAKARDYILRQRFGSACSRGLLARVWRLRCSETHSKTFRGLTTPSAPTLVAFGIIFLMARPPLLCKEGN